VLLWVQSYTFFLQYNFISVGRIGDQLSAEWLIDSPVARNFVCLTTKILHDTGVLLAANSVLLVLLERSLATIFRQATLNVT